MAKIKPLTKAQLKELTKGVKFGTKELDPDEFSPLYARAHISIKIPVEVLDRFRDEAERRGTKYQTLINECLQDASIQFASPENGKLERLIEILDHGSEFAKELRKIRKK